MATGKVEVFRTSYDEVLTALKHQDDKLNRMLTALAFLTTAGVALFVNVDLEEQFDHAGPGVGAVLFVVFMGAVALALLSALSAIGPGRPLASKREARTSLLFYPLIAGDDWANLKGKSAAYLENLLIDNYHHEARDIAYRVRYKVARARESSAFVQLAIVSLALFGIFVAPFSPETRWWIAASLLFFVLLSPFIEVHQMGRYKHDNAKWGLIHVPLGVAVIFVGLTLVWAQKVTDDYWVPQALAEPLLDTSAAARLLSVRPSWIYEAVRAGRIPHLKIGRHIRFLRSDLEDWVVSRRVRESPASRIRRR